MSDFRLLRQLSAPGAWLDVFAAKTADDRSTLAKRLVHARGNGVVVDALVTLSGQLRVQGVPLLLEVGLHGADVWVVHPASEGESLRTVITALVKSSSFLSPQEGLPVLSKVAGLMAQLHRAGIVHGDLCASSVHVGVKGEVQLFDTGLAVALGSAGEAGPFRHEIFGLAPEQLDEQTTLATDVFRLGLMLHECCTGRQLWTGGSHAQLAANVRAFQGLQRETIRAVPEPWSTLLVSLLARNPAQRPSMEEVAATFSKGVAQWSGGDDDVQKLIARALPARAPWFSEAGPGQKLSINALATVSPDTVVAAPSPSAPSAPGQAVVARIATRKMTAEALRAVQAASPEESKHHSPELKAALASVEKGLLTFAQVEAARAQTQDVARLLLPALVAQGIDEDALVSELATLTKTQAITAKRIADARPPQEVLLRLTLNAAQRAEAVPLGLRGTQVAVAMVDPLDEQALSVLRQSFRDWTLSVVRGGATAIEKARAKVYEGEGWRGGLELEQYGGPGLELEAAPLSVGGGDSSSLTLAATVIDAVLDLTGSRGQQGRQLAALCEALAKNLGGSEAEMLLARVGAAGLVAAALSKNRLPYETPPLVDVQELLGFGTAMDALVEVRASFPPKLPKGIVEQAIAVGFAFTAVTGEARPAPSRIASAIAALRAKAQLPPGVLDALTRAASGRP